MNDKNTQKIEQVAHSRYLIADVEVVVAENYLVIGGKKTPIEPKVMALLVYFIEHQHQVLSRDQLMAQVWQGTVVSDSALSWSISQLRKALNDKPSGSTFIKTISKKGYQFFAEVQVLPESTAGFEADTNSNFNFNANSAVACDINPAIRATPPINRYMWFAGLWIIFVIIFTVWFVTGEPKERYQLESGNFVTRLGGLEYGGRLSVDGKLMLFRHKSAVTDGRFQLMLKPMSENVSFTLTQNDGQLAEEKAPSRRAQTSHVLKGADGARQFDYKRAIWGVDDYQIIAVRHVFEQNKLAGCEIVRLKLPVSRELVIDEEVLHNCHLHGHSQISMDSQAKRLFFTDKKNTQVYQLYGLDLTSNSTVTLLDFPADYVGFGVRFIDYSRHNKQLLVLKDILNNETQFMALAFDDEGFRASKQENLFRLEAVYFSAYWGPKGRDIWYNWGNDKVMAIDVASLAQVYGNENQPNDRLHPISVSRALLNSANGWNYDARPVNDDLAVFVVSDANSSDLAFVEDANNDDVNSANKTNQIARTKTPFAESFGALAHNSDSVAFVSDQSGLPQIWLRSKSASSQVSSQVTNAERYFQFKGLAFSNDDSQILGVTGNMLASINLADNRFRIHYNDQLQPVFPRWFADGKRIVFSAKTDGIWRLYTIAANDKPTEAEPIGPLANHVSGYVAQPINQQQILFSRYERAGLWLLDINTLAETELVAGFPKGLFWRKLGKQVYFIATDKGHKGLYRTVLGQYKPQKVMDLPSGASHYFDVKATGDGSKVKVVFTDYAQYQSDLKSARVVEDK